MPARIMMTSFDGTSDVIRRLPLLLLLLCTGAWRHMETAPVQTQQQALDYLRQFGYLGSRGGAEGGDTSRSASQPESVVDPTAAILAFQEFAGLKRTGLLDDETLAMMSTSRCGVADNLPTGGKRRKRYALSGVSWPANQLTYFFRNYTVRLPQSTVRNTVRAAFQMWTNASSLVIIEGSDIRSANIHLLYAVSTHGDNFPFDGPGGVLAHAFYPDGGVLGGEAHFDDSEIWTVGQPAGTNLLQVTTHELGHTLGLAHSSDPASVMRPFYSGYDSNFHLGADDIRGIVELYGTVGVGNPKVSVSTVTTTTSQQSATTRQSTTDSHLCQNATIDAIVAIETETYAFIGDSYVILDNSSHGLGLTIRAGYPRLIRDDWPGLAAGIDAALYIPQSDSDPAKLFLFANNQFWRYSSWPSRQPDSGYPRSIANSFPGIPDNLDAAFVWGQYNHIYFIKGFLYYRYSQKQGIDRGYPQPLDLWPGLPDGQRISAAFRATDSRTYFFIGQSFYRFNDVEFKVENAQPLPTAQYWFGCVQQQTDTEQQQPGNQLRAAQPEVVPTNDVSRCARMSNFYCVVLLAVACLWLSKRLI